MFKKVHTLALAPLCLQSVVAGTVNYTDDFSTPSFTTNFTQTQGGIWTLFSKVGHEAPGLFWEGSSTTAVNGLAAYTGAGAADGWGVDGASGNVSWQFRGDSEEAITVGDRNGLYLSPTTSLGAGYLYFGTEVSAISATDATYNLVLANGSTTVNLGSFVVPDDSGSEPPNFWTLIGFDWTISGGVLSANYSMSGFTDDDGSGILSPTPFTASGSSSIGVSAGLGASTTSYFGLGGQTSGITGTPNATLDDFTITITGIPEPSTGILGVFGMLFLFGRRRKVS